MPLCLRYYAGLFASRLGRELRGHNANELDHMDDPRRHFLPFLMVTLLVTFSARERLRMKAPKTRLAIGGAGICLSLIIFLQLCAYYPSPIRVRIRWLMT